MSRSSLTRSPLRPARILSTESLEQRVLLAADTATSWQNSLNYNDVNQDGIVSGRDALYVVRDINIGGPRKLEARGAGEPGSESEPAHMVDTNGDGFLSPADALQVFEALNAPQGEGETLRIRLTITDTDGIGITETVVGDEFLIQVSVLDLRDGNEAQGVFALYTDILFDESLVAPTGTAPTFGSSYGNGSNFDFETPGLIDEIGSFAASTAPLGPSELVVFTVPMVATAAGTVTFSANPADTLPAREILFFGDQDPVPEADIDFPTAQLIVATAGSDLMAEDDSFDVAEDADPTVLSLLDNDTTTVNSAITSVTDASSGTVTLNQGQVSYQPNADFFGTDTFDYTIEDLVTSATSTATVTVTVTEVNDPPTANGEVLVTRSDTTTVFRLMNVFANDVPGPDNETLQILSLSNVEYDGTGVVQINGDGNIEYTPAPGFVGNETITYTIQDDGTTNGASDPLTAQATIMVTVQDNPVALADEFTVAAGVTTLLDVLENDDSLASLVTVASTTNGSTQIVDGQVEYTPNQGFVGSDTFSYTVSIGEDLIASAAVVVTVGSPSVAVDDSFTVQPGPMTFTVLDNDTLGDGATSFQITGVTQPANGFAGFTSTFDAIQYQPQSGFLGTDSFTYTIEDDLGATSTATVTVMVQADPVNVPPVAVDDTATVVADGGAQALNVLDNDSTEDGETLSIVSIVADPTNGVASIVTGGGEADNIVYTPNQGFTGTDQLEYQVSDGNGGTDNAIVTITVNAATVDPVALADSFVADSANVLTLNVLDNDTGDSLTIVSVDTTSTMGDVQIASDQMTLLYTPNLSQPGVDEFTYTIEDGNGETATATVRVDVSVPNEDPVAVLDTFTVDVADAQNFAVLSNDTTEDGETLTIVAVDTSSTAGTVMIANDGQSVTYTADLNQPGLDTFTYTIDDGNGGMATATVEVTVVVPNEDPVATDDSFTTDTAGTLTFDVLANDTTQPGETLTIVSVDTTGSTGTVTISADGTSLSYAPNFATPGQDTFTYTIDDGNGGTDMATVTVTVSELINSFYAGSVYTDLDNDGVRDPEDRGIGGVTLVLLGLADTGSQVELETVTDLDGDFRFDGIGPGNYTVRQEQPPFVNSGLNLSGDIPIVDGNADGLTTSSDEVDLAVGPQLIASGGNGFGERGLFGQFAALDILSSSRRDGLFVVLEGNELAWLENRGGWDDVGSLSISRDGDTLSLTDSSGETTNLSVSDRSTVELIGRSSVHTFLRINGSSEEVLAPEAVDALFAT